MLFYAGSRLCCGLGVECFKADLEKWSAQGLKPGLFFGALRHE